LKLIAIGVDEEEENELRAIETSQVVYVFMGRASVFIVGRLGSPLHFLPLPSLDISFA
jgi:hypothetical protein